MVAVNLVVAVPVISLRIRMLEPKAIGRTVPNPASPVAAVARFDCRRDRCKTVCPGATSAGNAPIFVNVPDGPNSESTRKIKVLVAAPAVDVTLTISWISEYGCRLTQVVPVAVPVAPEPSVVTS